MGQARRDGPAPKKEVLCVSDNWVVQNLENVLEVWNGKLSEIWQLITQSPQDFKGGAVWNVVADIHGALQAIRLRPAGTVLRGGRGQDLRQLCGSKIEYCQGKKCAGRLGTLTQPPGVSACVDACGFGEKTAPPTIAHKGVNTAFRCFAPLEVRMPPAPVRATRSLTGANTWFCIFGLRSSI